MQSLGNARHMYANHQDSTIFQQAAATKLATYAFNRLKARISELKAWSNLRKMQNYKLWLDVIMHCKGKLILQYT